MATARPFLMLTGQAQAAMDLYVATFPGWLVDRFGVSWQLNLAA